ncbi:Uncharacterized conserved protein, DUF2267 family [Limimonas halophila]|uniref:Uncharacterized conserved protein, DUF2267 family n=1 Tax=Limimonas halophila TaxID=1082479 RepID=A0A1G7Q2J8_9PROT|nr:DUF2267 domain-containing protein [Limimonas halophila]SDF92726.1 Uncharacterized conserved protein, DUF2267 family [Limimonas halophila]
MTTTGLDTFDTTIQETNIWLKQLMTELESDDRREAYHSLRASFHVLRDRLPPENAVHFGQQLPMLLRGLFYENWHIAGTPTTERHIAEFVNRTGEELPRTSGLEPEAALRASFAVMWDRMDEGEIHKTIRTLPAGLRDLWPRDARED